jgi:inhibitor of cysteine peptidase
VLGPSGKAARRDDSPAEVPVSEVVLTQVDAGKSISVRPGDTIIVRLPENPTTGYEWTVDTADDEIVGPRGSDFILSPTVAMGSGGTRAFTFGTKEPGMGRIRLKYWRAWEGESSVRDHFDVAIHASN